MTRWKHVIAGMVAAGVLSVGGWIVLAGDGERQAVAKSAPAAPAPEVQVAVVVSRTLPETATFTGRTAAVAHVDLRARVGGYVAAVRFREGSMVKRGQVLFELDAAPFRSASERAIAQLHQARERNTLASRQAARGQRLRAEDVISQAELDTLTAAHAESIAAIEAASASVRAAKLDLTDTRVRAPIAGRVGQALATEGNLVSGGSAAATLLTTIVSVDPLHVYFDVDEATFRRLGKVMRAGADQRDMKVRVLLAEETGAGRAATVDYLANQVDASTGTARARAVLANPDGDLTAGLFARVQLETTEPRPMTLIHDQAIGTSQEGRYVLVVNAKNIVEPRPVEPGDTVDGLRVIRTGLAAGDRVILKGMARPGMTVTPKVVPMQERQP